MGTGKTQNQNQTKQNITVVSSIHSHAKPQSHGIPQKIKIKTFRVDSYATAEK
jgi:hypothetical protein